MDNANNGVAPVDREETHTGTEVANLANEQTI